MRIDAPPPTFAHLVALSTPLGTFEHARAHVPRSEHGYCVDDVARVALLIAREPDPSEELVELGRSSLDFVAAAQDLGGAVRNRRSVYGVWSGPFTLDDCWGRALWAAGTMWARSTDVESENLARDIYERSIRRRSPWVRATAFGALGAVEVAYRFPDHTASHDFLVAAARILGRTEISPSWRWPESRLSYANASLCDALLATGVALRDDTLTARALAQLDWLVRHETVDGIIVPTPAGGLGPDDHRPRFDQQPIEVAALADACQRAFDVTSDPVWRHRVEMCVGWFYGANSLNVLMYDVETSGGYDGLTSAGPNINQGAESTVALLSTLQYAHAVRPVLA